MAHKVDGNCLLECLFFQLLNCFVAYPPLVMPHFLLTNLVPDRILSVNASIDTIGKILLKIIPTLEEVSIIPYLSLIY